MICSNRRYIGKISLCLLGLVLKCEKMKNKEMRWVERIHKKSLILWKD